MADAGFAGELSKSVVAEIAPDVWMLEGYIGDQFFVKHPSSNIYILRDGDSLVILDTGAHSFYRSRMLKIIERYKKEGVKRVILTLTQGHFDHASNNEVVLESGLQWKFLLPEPEVKTINCVTDMIEDLARLEEYENVYTSMFSWNWPTAVVRIAEKVSHPIARAIVRRAFGKTMGGIRTLAERADILSLEDRVTQRFGSVEFEGWQVGRFFLIHDGAHSPGHISLYDPENKLLLAGDVTIEINPAFFYSSIDRLIKTSGQFGVMAKEGYVELVGDGHRSKTFMPGIFEKYGLNPLHKTQIADVARGREECASFFGTFHEYYSSLKKEALSAHSRIGDSTVAEIVEELGASRSPGVQLKKAMKFPDFPSRMDVLVASVLKEAGVRPRKEGKRIVLSPAE
ncbi:MBL fold metallo-hydrolase [Candidatus Poribacteria bacterium]|nr:MBL fold metallo-hydrolase [Candidatus Poribacteria bacterium]